MLCSNNSDEVVEEVRVGAVKEVGNEIEEDDSEIKALYGPCYGSCIFRYFLEPEEGIADDISGSAFYVKPYYTVKANTRDIDIGNHCQDGN